MKRATTEVHATAAEFLEDGNYVQLETEGMHTEFLNKMEDSDGEEVTLADRGANNNAVLAEELSYQTQGAKGKWGSVQKGETLRGRSTQQMNKVQKEVTWVRDQSEERDSEISMVRDRPPPSDSEKDYYDDGELEESSQQTEDEEGENFMEKERDYVSP